MNIMLTINFLNNHWETALIILTRAFKRLLPEHNKGFLASIRIILFLHLLIMFLIFTNNVPNNSPTIPIPSPIIMTKINLDPHSHIIHSSSPCSSLGKRPAKPRKPRKRLENGFLIGGNNSVANNPKP